MPLKLRKPCRQVFHLPSTLNFEGVSPGTLFSSSIKWHESCCVLARDVVQFTSSGSLYYSYERLLTCAKNERTAYHEYIRSLSPAIWSCQGRRVHTAGVSYHLSARSQCLCQRGWAAIDGYRWACHGRYSPEPRLSRLFSNRVIARYPAFEEFYGMEDAIEQIVSYLKHAAQGWKRRNKSCICWGLWVG